MSVTNQSAQTAVLGVVETRICTINYKDSLLNMSELNIRTFCYSAMLYQEHNYVVEIHTDQIIAALFLLVSMVFP